MGRSKRLKSNITPNSSHASKPQSQSQESIPSEQKEEIEAKKSFFSKLKVLAYTFGVIVVTGFVTWISSSDVSSYISSMFRPVKIKVISPSRQVTDNFLAGEKIRFSLEDVNSERVIWVFDEKISRVANIETEYDFPFDPDQPKGVTAHHRVDVFFKDGASYKGISVIIRIQNISFEKTAANQ